MIRPLFSLLAIFGGFVLVGMLVAPSQPEMRSWYLQHACPVLDQLSPDICAAIRRESAARPI